MDLFTLTGKIVIETADAQQKIQDVVTEASGLKSSVSDIGDAAEESIGSGSTKKGFGAAAVYMGTLLAQLTTKAAGLAKELYKSGINYNATMEYYQAGFKTLLNLSDEGAKKFTETLKQFAVDTPLSLEGAMETAVAMLGAGFEESTLIENMSMLGDLALGDTEKMKGLAKALSDTKTQTKLLAQDARQFTNRGIPLYDMLLDYYRERYVIEQNDEGQYVWTTRSPDGMRKPGQYEISESDVKKLQKDGGISYEDVLAVLQRATGEGGKFYNAMNNAMDTYKGKMEKFGDAGQQATGNLLSSFFEVLKSDTLPKLTERLDAFSKWAEENPELLNNVATALSDLATKGFSVLLDTLEGVLTFWNEHGTEFNSLLVLLGGIAMASGHPLAGLALITTGGYGVWQEGEETAEEDWSHMKDQETVFAAMGGASEELRKAVESGDFSGVSKEEMDKYNIAKGVFSTTGTMFGVLENLGGAFDDVLGMKDDAGISMLMRYASEISRQNTEAAVRGEPLPFGNGLDMYLAIINDWMSRQELGFGDKRFDSLFNIGSGRRFGTGDEEENKDGNSGDGSNSSNAGGIPAGDPAFFNNFFDDPYLGSRKPSINDPFGLLTQVLANLKQDVATAAKEGVAAGMNGITITGTVTTGDVKLNEGAIVGTIAPRINLNLGWQDSMSGRGNA